MWLLYGMHGLYAPVFRQCLKNQSRPRFAVLTGVLRIAKESVFSGLNNLEVCSVLSDTYSDVLDLRPEKSQIWLLN